MNRILGFVLSCIVIIGIVVGVVYFASLDKIQNKIEYIVDGELYHTQSAFVNSELVLPQNPTRKDYDFAGWYYDDNSFTKEFSIDALGKGSFDENIKVYAKWTPHVHILTGKLTKKEDGKIEVSINCTVKNCDYKHNESDANVTSTITKTATCLENGEITYSYTHLGTTFTLKQGIAKTGHMLHNKPISQYLNSNGQISIDTPGVAPIGNTGYVSIDCGATVAAIYVCSTCSRSINITAIKNHDFSSPDSVLELQQFNPGLNEYYVVNAKCGRSDCDFATSFQAEKAFLTSRITESAKCQTDGKKTVTYKNLNSQIGPIEVSNDEAIVPATGLHKILGRADKPAKDYQNSDGSFNYYYVTGSQGNKTYTRMFKHDFANAESVDCGEYFEGYYQCATCSELIIVNIYKNHNYETLQYVAPTCYETGYIEEKCIVCLEKYDKILEKLEHSIAHVLEVVEDGNNFYEDNAFRLLAKCNKCDYIVEKGYYENNNAKLQHKITPPTCGLEGSIKTTLEDVVINGKTEDFICMQTIPATLKHILNGKIASEAYANADGTYNYYADGKGDASFINGIKLSANAEYLCTYHSGETQPGYFICEYCESLKINSVVLVNVRVNHTGDWKVANTATCSQNGTLSIATCTGCGDSNDATASTYTAAIPSTGAHAMMHKLELVEGDTFNLTTTCRFEACPYRETELVTATKTIYKTATCSEKGIYRYTYNKNGSEATCDIEYVDVNCHRINGQYMVVDNTTVLPSNMVGIIMPEVYDDTVGNIIQAGFVCEDCGRYIIVNVKIVK